MIWNLNMNPQKIFDYTEESQVDRIARKSKDSPFMIIGILGLIGVCGYGAYKFKSRGKMSTSVFLMQLRVAAQGTVVAALTVGVAYSLSQRFLHKEVKKE
nr:HIG1 domain family member 1A, mitochondrial-like isoform X2 [Maniola hyperantus]